MLKILLLALVVILMETGIYAQTGATGSQGGSMGAMGYLNYSAALGEDQQITGNATVTIGPNGNVDIYGSLQVDNGSTLQLLSGAVLNLYGNMTINGILAINSGATINYYGKNWTNGSSAQVTNNGILTGTPGNTVNFITPQPAVSASFTSNTPLLSTYSGATQQQDIDGNDIPMNMVMHIQNTSNVNLINTNTSLSGQLSFDVANGYVITNSYEFVFTDIASWLNAGTDRYIITNTTTGDVKKLGLANGSSFLFPVGYTSSSYTPANVQVTAGSTDNYHVNVNSFAASPPNEIIINPNVNRTWAVYSELNSAGGTSTNLSFVHYSALESAAYNDNSDAIFYRTDVGNWRSKACSAETVSPFGLPSNYYSQSIASVELPTCLGCANASNGTYFTKTNCTSTILPVTLGAFNAALANCSVKLNWNTYTEVNNKYFTVERKQEGGGWADIGVINSHNNINGGSYNYTDATAGDGALLYRLKITDADGKFSYSPVAGITRHCNKTNVQVYPNPAKDFLFVSLQKTQVTNPSLRLMTITGQLLPLQYQQSGSSWKVNISRISPGIYMLQVLDGQKVIDAVKIAKY